MAVTKAERIMLEGAGEAEWSRWVKARAKRYGWEGLHTRISLAVLESVHTMRADGYSECYGQPDWLFWSESFEEGFFAELKGASGHLSRQQKAQIPSLRKAGFTVFVWFPRDAELVDATFEFGLHPLSGVAEVTA